MAVQSALNASQGNGIAAPLMQAQSLASGNRFKNPSFEGVTRPVIFGEVNVFDGWDPLYCDKPYAPTSCPAERQGAGNPFGLFMGRPEYKPTDVANRVHSGRTAQQLFCFWRTCRAGVQQTIETAPGETCQVSVWVQSWSAESAIGTDGVEFHSETATKDQRDNSTWVIRVDPNGGTYAFGSGLLSSRVYGFQDGHYDKWAQIRYEFVATGPKTTIFFENLRLWPVAHNDSYIDDASVICAGAPATATPTPTPTLGVSPSGPAPVCPTTDACEPVVIVVTATPGVSTPAATPTKTAQPSPTMVTPTKTITAAPPICAWEAQGATDAKKKHFYTYTDPQRSGLYQRIRSGPGIEFETLDYIAKGDRLQVYWSIKRGVYTWWALDTKCSRWAAELGSIEEVPD
jgi:hypothetical protein